MLCTYPLWTIASQRAIFVKNWENADFFQKGYILWLFHSTV